MIDIHHFEQMTDLHQAGQVPFRIVQEIALVLLGLCGYDEADLPEAHAVTPEQIDWLLARPNAIDFMHYLGGNVHLCESTDDLQQVIGMDLEFADQHGRWPNITERVLSWDDCRYLINADGSTDHALVFAATNNAGGPNWFIPKALWQVARIDEQMN